MAKTVCSFNIDVIPAGTTVQFVARPQRPFQPEKLVIHERQLSDPNLKDEGDRHRLEVYQDALTSLCEMVLSGSNSAEQMMRRVRRLSNPYGVGWRSPVSLVVRDVRVGTRMHGVNVMSLPATLFDLDSTISPIFFEPVMVGMDFVILVENHESRNTEVSIVAYGEVIE